MNGTLDEAAELAQCSSIPRPMEAAGAVDAQNASTAPWKTLTNAFPTAPTGPSSALPKNTMKRYKVMKAWRS
jgi:hypothetical protein